MPLLPDFGRELSPCKQILWQSCSIRGTVKDCISRLTPAESTSGNLSSLESIALCTRFEHQSYLTWAPCPGPRLGHLGLFIWISSVHAEPSHIATLTDAGACGTVPRDLAFVVHAADRGAEARTGTASHGSAAPHHQGLAEGCPTPDDPRIIKEVTRLHCCGTGASESSRGEAPAQEASAMHHER